MLGEAYKCGYVVFESLVKSSWLVQINSFGVMQVPHNWKPLIQLYLIRGLMLYPDWFSKYWVGREVGLVSAGR